MLGNAVVRPDANGNIKVLKEYKSSTKRVDGVISSIMAVELCSTHDGPSKNFEEIMMLFK
jgi:phage terminase large subunit-like protein